MRRQRPSTDRVRLSLVIFVYIHAATIVLALASNFITFRSITSCTKLPASRSHSSTAKPRPKQSLFTVEPKSASPLIGIHDKISLAYLLFFIQGFMSIILNLSTQCLKMCIYGFNITLIIVACRLGHGEHYLLFLIFVSLYLFIL
jgi:hypothetical protein